jgi:Fic-DOC domain mobile mystery protein B
VIFRYKRGQTPIDAAEADALIPALTAQAELDRWEEQNIIAGRHWALSKRTLNRFELLSEDFIFELHRRMFSDTWKWAGHVRLINKNLGVPFFGARPRLRQLLDDARYWRDKSVYPFDEFAMRLHHLLVQIHVFANGNGRHARLFIDALTAKAGEDERTWGSVSLVKPGQARTAYLEALHAADKGDYEPLIRFSRS